tara:strand:+ start:88375 stop:88839 length:465 start_codon:yes stop_codon:yes gene_type:complete
MSKRILIVHTSWYEEYISEMLNISKEILEDFDCTTAVAPGALELAALAAYKILHNEESVYQDRLPFTSAEEISSNDFIGVLFLGIIIKGETSHYDLITKEVFRSINSLAIEHIGLSFINNVICVENKEQLEPRLVRNTTNNTKALIQLINEKSS